MGNAIRAAKTVASVAVGAQALAAGAPLFNSLISAGVLNGIVPGSAAGKLLDFVNSDGVTGLLESINGQTDKVLGGFGVDGASSKVNQRVTDMLDSLRGGLLGSEATQNPGDGGGLFPNGLKLPGIERFGGVAGLMRNPVGAAAFGL